MFEDAKKFVDTVRMMKEQERKLEILEMCQKHDIATLTARAEKAEAERDRFGDALERIRYLVQAVGHANRGAVINSCRKVFEELRAPDCAKGGQ